MKPRESKEDEGGTPEKRKPTSKIHKRVREFVNLILGPATETEERLKNAGKLSVKLKENEDGSLTFESKPKPGSLAVEHLTAAIFVAIKSRRAVNIVINDDKFRIEPTEAGNAIFELRKRFKIDD